MVRIIIIKELKVWKEIYIGYKTHNAYPYICTYTYMCEYCTSIHPIHPIPSNIFCVNCIFFMIYREHKIINANINNENYVNHFV